MDGVVATSSMSGLLSNSSACSTKGFHVNRAIEFYKKSRIYFALAKESEWPGATPPDPDYYDELEQPWGYKRVETKYLVVPDDQHGTILYQNRKFRIVTETQAKAEGARWVYCMSYVNYDELPFKTYHQVGVVTNIVTKEGVSEGAYALTPDMIEDPGDLEILNNRRGIGREADMREQIAVIIEF